MSYIPMSLFISMKWYLIADHADGHYQDILWLGDPDLVEGVSLRQYIDIKISK